MPEPYHDNCNFYLLTVCECVVQLRQWSHQEHMAERQTDRKTFYKLRDEWGLKPDTEDYSAVF